MAVQLRPQQVSGDSGNGSGGSEGEGSLKEGFLPSFRLERKGLAVDEYHAHGDGPYEEELAKRVEAALSLSRPEDASERASSNPLEF